MRTSKLWKHYQNYCGTTDVEGQLSQINITEDFLEGQIRQAQEEKNKNEKMYNKLGLVAGLGIVIILI